MKCVYVDDEKIFLERAAKVADRYFKQSKVGGEFVLYQDPELLRCDLREGRFYDLYLLDIELRGEQSGLDLARAVREADQSGQIVFLTSHSEYAIQGYDYHAFQYILKDQIEKLDPVLDEIAKKTDGESVRFLVIETPDACEKIELRDILYICKEGKDCVVVCENNKLILKRKTLRQVYDEMELSEMYQCGQSYIVNLSHIQRVSGAKIFFDTNKHIFIPRSYKKSMKDIIKNYWKEHNGIERANKHGGEAE